MSEAPSGHADPGGAMHELIDLAERAAYEYGPDRQRLAAVVRERADEVVALLRRSILDEPAVACRLAAALPPFWEDTGRVETGRRLTEAAIERAGEEDDQAAGAHLAASELAFRQGDQAEATRHAWIAIDGAMRSGSARVAALGHVNLARVAYRDGIAREIDAQARRALEIAPDDPAARRGAIHMLAWAAHTGGDLAVARDRFEESLELRRSQGDRFGTAIEIANLADLAVEEGDLRAAADRLAEALEVAVDLDSVYLVLNLLPSLSVLAATTGDDESAARLLGAADGVGERSGLVPDPGAWQPALDDAERHLGPRFATLREEGRVLTLGDAVALGRRVAGSLRGDRGFESSRG